MLGLPPATALLFGVHLAVGVTSVFFWLRLKRSFRWVLLLLGCVELIGAGVVLLGALGARH